MFILLKFSAAIKRIRIQCLGGEIMNPYSSAELSSIRRELDSIITELESISTGLRKDFVGIGSEKCANRMDRVLSHYYFIRRKLNNIDTTSVVEGFK